MTGLDTTQAVLVVVGTDVHPFDRLVGWIDGWLESRIGLPLDCVVQYGTSGPPRLADGHAFLKHSSVEQLMREASVVVSHGGPTTIAEARRAGHRPVVVPRVARLGEHVDNHQVRFVARLSAAGLIDVVESEEDLATAAESRLCVGTSGRADVSTDTTQAARKFGEVVEEILQARRR